jgi:hypothetical protein
MSAPLRCGKSPCSSCPYRRDVPAGIWSPEEYAKLPEYDGETGDQIMAGAVAVFLCHQQPGRLCAGWVGCHDMRHNAAIRFNPVDPMVHDYKSPVALFGSGAEAAAHGMSGVKNPGPEAKAQIEKLLSKHARLREGKNA